MSCCETETVKACKCCGRTFTIEGWDNLELVGLQEFPAEFGLPAITLEMRNCDCHTTLAVKKAN